MVDFSQVTQDDVRQALAEYDRVGQEVFLKTHGFGRSRGYELIHDAKPYDSKAILGVAHGYATGTTATRAEFSGGRHGAAPILKALGFEVTEPTPTSPEIIPATGAWREASDVGSRAARDAWAVAAREVLLDVARRYHSVLAYKELAEEVQRQTGIRTRQMIQHWIGEVLERVALECQRQDEPMLSALVVDSTGSVGGGYAKAVHTVTGTSPANPDGHAAAERLACHRHFTAPDLPGDGGQPALTPRLATRRERMRTAAATPAPAPLCPSCFITLPATGTCDNCS